MPKKDQLQVNDVGIAPAMKFPGKKNRNNPSGSVHCGNKSEWVESEALKWYNYVKDLEKYDKTPLHQKTFLLANHHLKKMKIANSVARRLIVKFEECNVPIVESEEDDEEIDNDEMEIVETVETVEEMDTEDMFANSDSENGEDTLTRIEKENIIDQTLLKPIEELIEFENSLPKFVTRSYRFQSTKFEHINNYVETEFEGKSSQDILNVFSQTPSYVRDSDLYKRRLDHLPKHERSEKRMLKNANSALSLLKQSGTPKSLEHRKIITSALYDPQFGYPRLCETRTVKTAGKMLNTKLRSGESTDLKPDPRSSTDYFPQSVKDIANTCWRTNCTVIEPGKHARPKAAIKDGNETIPIIYQTLTDKEAYSAFKEIYVNDVKEAVAADCNLLLEKLESISDTKLKEKKLEFIEKKKSRFPSLSWFLKQKPKETKASSDHCTGLCKDCEGPQINFEILRKHKKSLCQCQTKMCPNWFCTCELDEFEEVPSVCDCAPCLCDACSKCQVNIG